MCEITALGDFQGLWEEGKAGQLHRSAFHAFHQTGISTAFRRGRDSVLCGVSGTCTRSLSVQVNPSPSKQSVG
jgi:hypothetical protein